MLAELQRLSDRHRPPTTARGLPQLGEMPVGFRLPAADDSRDATPYRLPKLTSSPDPEDQGGIYSRYGYTHANPYENYGERGQGSFKWKYPLPTKSFRIYPGPSFHQAAVAPSSTPRLVLPGSRPPEVNRLLFGRSQTTLSGFNNTRPTPVSRFANAAASATAAAPIPESGDLQMFQVPQPDLYFDTSGGRVAFNEVDGSLQWMLNPQRHFQVDRKGQQRNQGPFSREFTVHAMAPPNWLRMKWGRRQQQLQQQQQQQRLLTDGSGIVSMPGYLYRQCTGFSEPGRQQ